MSKVQQIEQEVASLAPDDLAAFRQWFAAFDADSWDRQIASDVAAGRLDSLAERALSDHVAGKSRAL